MCNLPKIPNRQLRLEQRILAYPQSTNLLVTIAQNRPLFRLKKAAMVSGGHLEEKEKILSPARSRTWIPGFKVPCANRYTTGDSCWPLMTMTFIDNSVPETATIGARQQNEWAPPNWRLCFANSRKHWLRHRKYRQWR